MGLLQMYQYREVFCGKAGEIRSTCFWKARSDWTLLSQLAIDFEYDYSATYVSSVAMIAVGDVLSFCWRRNLKLQNVWC